MFSNDAELVRRLRATPGLPEDFFLAGESLYDREYEYYQLSYYRTRED